jgi:hypothetical protein
MRDDGWPARLHWQRRLTRYLVRKRIDDARIDREERIKLMGDPDSFRFGAQ